MVFKRICSKFGTIGLLIWIYSLLMPDGLFAQSSTIQSQFPYTSSTSIEIDPSTGTANYGIPLRTPPTRGSIIANFCINYNSSQSNGIFGVGWSHSIGYIERSIKNGVPKYDQSDTFQIMLAGMSSELVQNPATGYYHPEIESTFYRIEYIDPYWIVTDTNGTKYYFGETAASRIVNPSLSTHIYRWALDKIVDVAGNDLTISYLKDNNYLYPDEIRYTGNLSAGLTPYALIKFNLQPTSRSDSQVSYHPGFEIKMRKLVDSIVITANDNHYARYNFVYTQSTNSYRTLLQRVEMDHGIASPAIPSMTFTYQNQKNFSQDTQWNIPSNLEFFDLIESQTAEGQTYYVYQDTGVRLADINNDGFIDMLKSRNSTASGKIYINNRGNGYTLQSGGFPSGAEAFVKDVSGETVDKGIKLVDINGDGQLDWIQNLYEQTVPLPATHKKQVFLGDNGSWTANQSSWYLPDETPIMKNICSLFCFQYFVGTLMVDINNDGLVDIVRSHKDSSLGDTHVVYLNTGSGWIKDNSWNLPNTEYTDFTDGATLVDLNGDDLPDIFYIKSSQAHVYMNKGDGWYEDSNSPWGTVEPFTSIADGSTQMHDVNGDGLVDMVFTRMVVPASLHGSTYGRKVIINTGYGWQNDLDWNVDPGDFQVKGTRMFDVNGDGLSDFITNYDDELKVVYLNQGDYPDLLIQVDNGLGGTRTIAYVPSTSFEQKFMPFARPVVGSITDSDSYSSDSFATVYEYYDGVYDASERTFMGFGEVRVLDPEANYVKTKYHTDPIKHGRPLEEATYDQDDNLYRKTVYDWQVQNLFADSDFVYLVSRDDFVYDGDSTGRRTSERYSYVEGISDVWFLQSTQQLGEVNLVTGDNISTEDDRTVDQYYVNNIADWIIGKPIHTMIKDSEGTPVRQTWLYYDDHTELDEVPDKGFVTKQVSWLEGNETNINNPVVRYEYTLTGNLVKTYDPKYYLTEVTYENSYQLFPITIANDVGHEVHNEYYGVDGVQLDDGNGLSGMWGQLKSTRDPNNEKSFNVYDQIGRPIQTMALLDSVYHPTSMREFTYLSDYTRLTNKRRLRHGQGQTIDVVQFTDGLGRTIQSKSPSHQTGQFVVSGQVEYNSRGLPIKTFLPYFSSNPQTVIDQINPDNPFTSIEYDAMGRVIRNTNPDGTYSTVEYDDWTTRTIDENGHKKESDFDAYGRLIEKREYIGADGRSEHYPFVPYSLYAKTKYEYTSEGDLKKTIDQHGNEVLINYDKLGRKINMIDPDMGSWSDYVYDLNSNLIEQLDAKGKRIFTYYDSLNRLKEKTDMLSIYVDYSYDDPIIANSLGRLTNVSYDNGYTDFMYDERGREIQSIKSINNIPYQVDRNYEALDNLIHVQYPDGEKIYYDYNDAGQIKSISNDPSLFGPQSRCRPLYSDSIWSKLWGGFERYFLGVKPAYAYDYTSDTDCVAAYKFDEVVGDAIDLCGQDGSNDNGSVDADVIQTGTHYIFNGDDGHINFGDVTFLDGETNASFCLEAKVDAGALGGTQSLFRKDAAWTPLQYADGKWRAIFWSGTRRDHNNINAWIPDDNSWHAYCYTYDNTTRIAYRDGVVIGTLTDTGGLNNASANFYIGGKGTSESFNGQIKNVIILKRELTSTEVIDIRDNGLIGAQGSNKPPVVNAGEDQSITLPNFAYLNGMASDDNLSTPPHMTTTWSQVEGPANAVFGDTSQINTTISFSIPGNYILRLTANDGQLQATDDVIIAVNAQTNLAPVVSAGIDQSVTLANSAILNGTATDDDLPIPPSLTITWSQFSGPGIARFADNSELNTTVTFSIPGTYVLRLTANDTVLEAQDDITITVQDTPPPGGNFLADVDCVAAYRFDEVTGNAIDLCTLDGSQDDGLVHANTMRNGSYYNFDGVAAHVNFGDVTFLDGQDQASFCLEAKVESGALGGTRSLFRKDGAWTPLQYASDKWRAILWSGARRDHYNIDTWIPDDDTWHSYCYVYDGTTRIAYRDGVSIATISDAGGLNNSSKNFYIGGKATSESFKGDVKNVIIFKRALSTEEVVDYRDSGFGGGGETGGGGSELFVKNIEYNPAGQITRIEYGNGVVTDNEYDPMFRLQRVYTHKPDAVLQDLSYTYDSVGNIKTITDTVNSSDQTFEYDHLNRLKQAVAPESYGTKDYAYNEIGNIISKDGRTFTYGAANAGPHAVTRVEGGGQPTLTFTYDANGNMLTKQQLGGSLTEYDYDVENRLIEVKKDTVVIATYEYDGDGGRSRKITPTEISTFVGSIYEERGGAAVKHVFLGAQRIATVSDNKVFYYHYDHLGGTNVTSDEDGIVQEIIEYQPFGKAIYIQYSADPEIQARNLFTSHFQEADTRLIYMLARYYDSEIGRFITPDTIVQDVTNPQTLNRYAYVSNNPINNIDPSGHGWFKKLWKTLVGAVFGAIVGVTTGGLGFSLAAAGFFGGATAGAITGGLNNGWRGGLLGGLIGGLTGTFGGWGVDTFGNGFGLALLAVGAGVSVGTKKLEGLAHFGVGLFGGAVGSYLGNSLVQTQHFQNLKVGNGFRSNSSVRNGRYITKIKALRQLSLNQKNTTVERISRPLGKSGGGPGSTTGPRHNALLSNDFPNGVVEMGPDGNGLIQTTNTIGDLQNWNTAKTTQQAIWLNGDYIDSFQVAVNKRGLLDAINLYEQTFAGQQNYNPVNHNSNFAVNSWIYAAGGNIPTGGRAPGFPTTP